MDIIQRLQEVGAEATPELMQLIEASMQTLREALNMYKPEEIALSFNGGKDCTVTLHLLRAVLKNLENTASLEQEQMTQLLTRVKFVHFVNQNEFEQIEEFRGQMENLYGIRVQLYSSDFKREVQRLIEVEGIKAIIMGNRSTDPWSKDLQPFTESSEGWPSFMRVFPILRWDYSSIWRFLRLFELPYCCLYDQGFTSLGEKHNSQPNPSLKVEGQDNLYRPAYELTDDSLERLSRL